jgi:asparagine synthetase B (glutamine-hydrolysing)
MCGYGVTNKEGIESANTFCVKRGPDETKVVKVEDIYFLHNLLHITGEKRLQPFIKNNKYCVFNGQIYNYKSFGDYASDGECLIDLYEEKGDEFCKYLDGEFSICLIDFTTQKIIISVDTFSCKPLWYEFNEENFCVASYQSQLKSLNFNNGKKLTSNTTKIYSLKEKVIQKEYSNKIFNLRQHKKSYDDWMIAFSNSIKKRTKNTNCKMFLGLSSGFDSGAIACELIKQEVNFKAYSIINNENFDIINQRSKFLKEHELYMLESDEFFYWKNELLLNCEDFSYSDKFRSYNIKMDKASMGLASICSRASKEKRRIYFSGQGADEIISDYGFNGKKIYSHSEFGGKFPENLNGFFPWHSFFDGTQIQYLNKEEYVAGHFGIETRYPFLDNDLVQEFLWLDSTLKNKKYKGCIDEYLTINKFPFCSNEKRGFNVIGNNNLKNGVI